jgi:uncharacterized protein YndB with AHSA1/START domain
MDYDPTSFAPVNISQHFPMPAEAVFDAWTTPSVMAQWVFTSRNREIRKIDLDLRVGGRFEISEWTGQEFIRHFGTFQKIDRPHGLSFTLEVPQRFSGVSHCIIGIASTPDGCVMTFQQTGVPKELGNRGWRAMFRTLAEVLTDSTNAVSISQYKSRGTRHREFRPLQHGQ